ncbi:glucokinase [Constrictibacter sp. MBR-5]|jgi:glucokinase|uniref:glucokinase n=1 Tax=Constrictibacter sp. MBR-5 TaxID=3156467 RepID=UPI00339B07BE
MSGVGAADGAALVADIGGTNARFARVGTDGRPVGPLTLRAEDHDGLAEAVEAYLEALPAFPRPRRAAFAVASPIIGDRVSLTNRNWAFSIEAVRRRLGLDRLEVINDFTAVALSLPRLQPHDLRSVGGGKAVAGAPLAVLGPGTGLGMSGLVPAMGRWVALAAEGGHATMSPADDRESEVLRLLRNRYHHVSVERVVSGQGLVNLYESLAMVEGARADALDPEDITRRGAAGDPLCREAVDMLCCMLGTAASNLALTLGARGGVFIAGGIVPRLGDVFLRSGFRERFEDKGRFRAYLAAIPTAVIVDPVPAFLGLAALLEDEKPGVAA